MKTSSTSSRGWKAGKRLKWDARRNPIWTYLTTTDKPKGKAGVLVTNLWMDFGQKRFEFRKFNVKHKAFEDAHSFIKALERRGFKKLGDGAFSTVLGKDKSTRVIKVIRRPDGWIDYIHWASRRGEAGKFAPRVFSYKKIKAKKSFSIAIMERLEYTFEDAPRDHALKIIPEILWRAKDNPMAASFVDILAPGLKKFMDDLGKEFDGRFDLHNGNLMVRKDGSFVVSDPVAGKEKTDYKRLKAGDFSPVITSVIGFKRLARTLIENCNKHRSERIYPGSHLGHCV